MVRGNNNNIVSPVQPLNFMTIMSYFIVYTRPRARRLRRDQAAYRQPMRRSPPYSVYHLYPVGSHQANRQLVLAVGPVHPGLINPNLVCLSSFAMSQMRRHFYLLLGAWIVDGAGNATRVPNNVRRGI